MLTGSDLIEYARSLRDDASAPRAWISPEVLERNPDGFVVRPDYVDDALPDGSKVEAFCNPAIPVEVNFTPALMIKGWDGPFVVGMTFLDGRNASYFYLDGRNLDRVVPDCVSYVAPVVWYSVSLI